MRVLVTAATGIAAAALAVGPITNIRAQQKRVFVPVTAPRPVARVESVRPAADLPLLPSPHPIRVTAELVRATIVRSPPAAVAPPIRHEARPKPLPPRRSLLARLFFGAGEYRPKPFPRPGS